MGLGVPAVEVARWVVKKWMCKWGRWAVRLRWPVGSLPALSVVGDVGEWGFGSLGIPMKGVADFPAAVGLVGPCLSIGRWG